MNNQRRKQIKEIIEKLEEVMGAIEVLKDAEEECYDNLPENIQYSLEYASYDVADLIDNLYSVIE